MGPLRFLLALSVVFQHNGGPFHYQAATGPTAVQVFFMISGFLMQLVLSVRYDPRNAKLLFYSNRVLRLFPIYLLVLALTLIVAAAQGGSYLAFLGDRWAGLPIGDRVLLIASALFIIGQEWFLFMRSDATGGLAWSGGSPDASVWPLQPVPQAWSLSLELMFYAIAPFLVRVRTGWLMGAVAALLMLQVVLVASGLPGDPWIYRFFPCALPYFLLGMIACRERDRIVAAVGGYRVPAMLMLVVTLLISPAGEIAGRLHVPFAAIRTAYVALAIVGIPALFAWSSAVRHSRLGRIEADLGDLSYPIYIIHIFVLMILRAVWPPVGTQPLGIVLASTALTLLLSWAVVVGVERPIDRYRARRRRAGTAAASHPGGTSNVEART